MSKIYRRKSGLVVVSGPVVAKESAPQGTKVSIEIREMDQETRQWNTKVIDATSNAVDVDVQVGSYATAVGYQCGVDMIMASVVTTGPHVYCPEPDVEIVSGEVNKAVLKTELNDDGTPKLKRDGSPRKPHFDVSVIVPNEHGKKVIHTIKIYNYKEVKNGQKTEIEKAQAKFQDFEDRDSTPMDITVVTQPGLESSWESEYNGRVYPNFGSSHLGKMSWDVSPRTEGAVREATPLAQTAPVQTPNPMPAPVVAPTPAPAPTQQYAAPQFAQEPAQPQYQQPQYQQPQMQVQPQKVFGSQSIQLEDDDPVNFS